MSQEITLQKARDTAEQVLILCRLVESYPHHLEDNEIAAIAGLLTRFSSDVFCWLSNELVMRGKTNEK